MTTLLLPVALAAGLMLLWAGVGHLCRPMHFAAILASHKVVSRSLGVPAAFALGVIEVGIGAWLLSALIVELPAFRPLVSAAALYTLFAMHVARLLAMPEAVPCGCSIGDRPANAWALGRTAVLAAALSACALISNSTALAAPGAQTMIFLVLIGAVLAMVAWVLPDALHIPGRTRSDKFAVVR